MFILSIIALVAALAIATNWYRKHSCAQTKYRLMPNCLMTRSPIVFVSGVRSPFYFLNYWNRVPQYLREHGYEVMELDLPWRQFTARIEDLRLFLETASEQKLSFHFILDVSSEREARWLAELNHPVVKSLNFVNKNTAPFTIEKLFNFTGIVNMFAAFCHWLYLPKNLAFSPVAVGLDSYSPTFDREKEFLRLAISLAEKEIKLDDSESGANTIERSRSDIHQ